MLLLHCINSHALFVSSALILIYPSGNWHLHAADRCLGRPSKSYIELLMDFDLICHARAIIARKHQTLDHLRCSQAVRVHGAKLSKLVCESQES